MSEELRQQYLHNLKVAKNKKPCSHPNCARYATARGIDLFCTPHAAHGLRILSGPSEEEKRQTYAEGERALKTTTDLIKRKTMSALEDTMCQTLLHGMKLGEVSATPFKDQYVARLPTAQRQPPMQQPPMQQPPMQQSGFGFQVAAQPLAQPYPQDPMQN